MPFRVQLTKDAARDLEEICDYIDRHDAPARSDHVLEQVEKAFHSLSKHPQRGNFPMELRAASTCPPKPRPCFWRRKGGGLGLTDRPVTTHGVRQMLKRRLHEAGLPEIITPHSFRVMVVTDLLGQNVPMEDVQYLAGHSNPQTTQIYDRRRRRVTRNIIERISV